MQGPARAKAAEDSTTLRLRENDGWLLEDSQLARFLIDHLGDFSRDDQLLIAKLPHLFGIEPKPAIATVDVVSLANF